MSWISLSPSSKTLKLGNRVGGYLGPMKNPRLREGDGLARDHQLLHPLGSLTKDPRAGMFPDYRLWGDRSMY